MLTRVSLLLQIALLAALWLLAGPVCNSSDGAPWSRSVVESRPLANSLGHDAVPAALLSGGQTGSTAFFRSPGKESGPSPCGCNCGPATGKFGFGKSW